jgi:hypothetical protein
LRVSQREVDRRQQPADMAVAGAVVGGETLCQYRPQLDPRVDDPGPPDDATEHGLRF